MVRIRLVVEYHGANYGGWQVQDNTPTVQGSIENAIKQLVGEDVRIHGAGRTDSSVHALGQVCHFDTDSSIPAEKFAKAINSKLPSDIRILTSKQVDTDFHARFSAKGKAYRYIFMDRDVPSALYSDYAWQVGRTLDVEAMNRGAAYFLGTHDFIGFMSTGSQVKDTVRTITRINIYRKDDRVIMDIEGNGFLYNMVRIIAGCVMNVGIKKWNADYIKTVIASKDRNMAGITAPAHGLYMVRVLY